MTIRKQVPLSPLTSFQIGGAAKYFVEVKTASDIQETLDWTRENNVPFYVIGGGSNLLVPDEGLEGIVIHIVGNGLRITEKTLECEAGCNLLTLIHAATDRNLGGWEKLAGIPGTIGGAVRGNAGAFGPEIKDFVSRVHAMNTKTGEMKEFSNGECDFSYRMSFFKKNPEWIITHVHLNLDQCDTLISKRLIEETIQERERRHIQNVRAAGSFFMNPKAPADVQALFEQEKNVKSREGRVPAGWLIEKAGMKGVRVGGAMSSEQHPNYLVNENNATSRDVLELAAAIKQAVYKKFEVPLEEEAVILNSSSIMHL